MCAGADPTIFMKTNNLVLRTYDVYENKGSCAPRWAAPNAPKDRRGRPKSAPPYPIADRGSKKELLNIRSKPECV
jgi:hypothetical protein